MRKVCLHEVYVMSGLTKREQLINTAVTLFCENGYHATGIDRLLKESGISKKTMYHHFRSKDELIYAALRHYDSVFRNDFMKKVKAAGETPEQQILAIFDVAHTWFLEEKFFGCMFINAIGEYSEKESPIRNISKQFKQFMWDFVADLVKQANLPEREQLADEICLLLEGAIVVAQVSQKPEAAMTAKSIAKTLLYNGSRQ